MGNLLISLALITEIILGIVTLLSYVPKIHEFLKNKKVDKLIFIIKILFVILGIVATIMLATGTLRLNVQEDRSQKIETLADAQCLENPSQNNTLDFEWIIQSEEDFDTRIAYYVVPYSSGIYSSLPFFYNNWNDLKLIPGNSTIIKNEINYSNSKKGRYSFCATILDKTSKEQELKKSCCIKTLKADFE